jgi:hypothetical protein
MNGQGGPAPPWAGLPEIPGELRVLAERVRSLPAEIRRGLEPAVEDAVEQAVYRGRVLTLAREALARFRHDIELIRFDLEQTRAEREALRQRLDSRTA